jgi:integrase
MKRRTLEPGIYLDTKVPGLRLEVRPPSARYPEGKQTYYVWTRVKATNQAVHVSVPGPLRAARITAREIMFHAAMGRHVGEERKRAKAAGSVAQLFITFLADVVHHVREKTIKEWRLLLNHPRLSKLRSRPTLEVTRRELIVLFDKIAEQARAEGREGYVANRTMEVIRRAWRWGVERELIPIEKNPFSVPIRKAIKERPRTRSYNDAEIAALWAALDETAMARAIRFVMWTACRISEALTARWENVDLDAATWTVPADAEGNKAQVDRLVPLVPDAVAFLRTLPRLGPYVFGTESRAVRQSRICKRIAERSGVEGFRPHDVRRAVSSWLASRAGGGVPQPVRDAILGHRPAGLEGIYNVHSYVEEKRTALENWAMHIKRITSEPSKVVAMVRS